MIRDQCRPLEGARKGNQEAERSSKADQPANTKDLGGKEAPEAVRKAGQDEGACPARLAAMRSSLAEQWGHCRSGLQRVFSLPAW